MQNKYDFYDVVRVMSSNSSLSEINGKEGTILGMSRNKETGDWGYSITFDDEEECWDLIEYDLQPTGKKRKREDFYTKGTARVIIDPKTGEGSLVDD